MHEGRAVPPCVREGRTCLAMMTGPSWQWSPTNTTCLAPSTSGSSASGSVAWVASSISSCAHNPQ